MKRLLTAAVLVTLLPLTASADTCIGTNISRFPSGGPQMGELLVPEDTPVRVEIVGTFLWYQVNDSEIVSVEVPTTADGFTACESGLVTFTFPEIAEDATSAPVQPAPIVVDIIDMWRPWFPGSPV